LSLFILSVLGVRVMVFNATFNNVSVTSWLSVLLVEETGVNHRHVANHWQTLPYYTPRLRGFEFTTLVVVDNDSKGSCRSNYNTYDHDHDGPSYLLELPKTLRWIAFNEARYDKYHHWAYLNEVNRVHLHTKGRRGGDWMVVGFRTTCAISAHHY
jgi:hypothetical protein